MAFGKGSMTVAMTSIASSFGKRLPSSFSDRRQFFFVDDLQDLLCYRVYRPHAVHLTVNTQRLIKLGQRVGFLVVSPEALLDQIFAVIGSMNELPAAQVTYLILYGRLAELVVNLATPGTHQPADEALFFSQPLGIGRQLDHGQPVTILYEFPER